MGSRSVSYQDGGAPHPQTPGKKAGKRGRLKNLTGGVGGEMEARWGGQEFLGSKLLFLISTRLAEEGYWSQFLGGAFVQCGDILDDGREQDSTRK